jgi:hypothetical protein
VDLVSRSRGPVQRKQGVPSLGPGPVEEQARVAEEGKRDAADAEMLCLVVDVL